MSDMAGSPHAAPAGAGLTYEDLVNLPEDGKRYEIFGAGGGQALAAELEVPLLGQVPLLPALREGADRGAPVALAAAGSEAAQAFDAIAGRVAALRPRVRRRAELAID